MQQTILALGALMIIMMMSLSHQRTTLVIQEASIVRELETAALDLAKLRTETILSRTRFDENWNSAHLPGSPTLLTPSNGLGHDGEANQPADFNDVDDYHNFAQLNVPHAIGTDTFRFNIDYSVSYIDNNGNTTSTQTFAKQLTAHVVSADTVGSRVAQAFYSKTTIISEDN